MVELESAVGPCFSDLDSQHHADAEENIDQRFRVESLDSSVEQRRRARPRRTAHMREVSRREVIAISYAQDEFEQFPADPHVLTRGPAEPRVANLASL
jgi:hypothetical protein